jgi:hypothetical protein
VNKPSAASSLEVIGMSDVPQQVIAYKRIGINVAELIQVRSTSTAVLNPAEWLRSAQDFCQLSERHAWSIYDYRRRDGAERYVLVRMQVPNSTRLAGHERSELDVGDLADYAATAAAVSVSLSSEHHCRRLS